MKNRSGCNQSQQQLSSHCGGAERAWGPTDGDRRANGASSYCYPSATHPLLAAAFDRIHKMCQAFPIVSYCHLRAEAGLYLCVPALAHFVLVVVSVSIYA